MRKIAHQNILFYEIKSDIGTVERWSPAEKRRVRVPQPAAISAYNKNMGGVDMMDQAIAVYRSRIRQKKWWWPIFAYLLDASVVNAWKLNKAILKNQRCVVTLLSFRRHLIALHYLKKYGAPSSQGRQVALPSTSIRLDGLNHWPQSIPSQRRCAQCSGKALFICSKCQIDLHSKCFALYHTKD